MPTVPVTVLCEELTLLIKTGLDRWDAISTYKRLLFPVYNLRQVLVNV